MRDYTLVREPIKPNWMFSPREARTSPVSSLERAPTFLRLNSRFDALTRSHPLLKIELDDVFNCYCYTTLLNGSQITQPGETLITSLLRFQIIFNFFNSF